MEMQIATAWGNKYFHNLWDVAATASVVESTKTRFTLYLESDIIYVYLESTMDSGDVKDTITCYYNRIIYNRTIVTTAEGVANGWRPHVFTWIQGAIEDSIVFADDDEIDIVSNILHAGQKTLPTGQDTLHAQEFFRTNNDTTFLEFSYSQVSSDDLDRYISHDEATRRGSGHGANAAIPEGTYGIGFVFEFGTLNHTGTEAQEIFIDYMNPCPIAMTYGTGGDWVETRGCYQVTDGGGDSVKFKFDRPPLGWQDSTVFTPVIEVASWDGAIPDSIYVGGVKKDKDTDFYADTVDALNFLVVHWLGNLSGDTEFIIPARTGAAPTGVSARRRKILTGGTNE